MARSNRIRSVAIIALVLMIMGFTFWGVRFMLEGLESTPAGLDTKVDEIDDRLSSVESGIFGARMMWVLITLILTMGVAIPLTIFAKNFGKRKFKSISVKKSEELHKKVVLERTGIEPTGVYKTAVIDPAGDGSKIYVHAYSLAEQPSNLVTDWNLIKLVAVENDNWTHGVDDSFEVGLSIEEAINMVQWDRRLKGAPQRRRRFESADEFQEYLGDQFRSRKQQDEAFDQVFGGET